MTCSDFVNPFKMLICSKKHPVSGANHDYIKKVVIDRWTTKWKFISKIIFYKF